VVFYKFTSDITSRMEGGSYHSQGLLSLDNTYRHLQPVSRMSDPPKNVYVLKVGHHIKYPDCALNGPIILSITCRKVAVLIVLKLRR
jgi:hypothetical protein